MRHHHILFDYDPAYVIAVLVAQSSPEIVGYIVYEQDGKVGIASVEVGDFCPLPDWHELAYYPYRFFF